MKKGLKIAGISIVLAGTVITGVHFMTNKTVATNASYQAVVADFDVNETEGSSNYDGASLIADELATYVAPTQDVTEQATTGAVIQTEEATTVEESTEAATEAVTETPTEATTEAPTEATTAAPTEAATQAPTEAAKPAATQAVTEAAKPAATQAATEAAKPAATQAATEAAKPAATQAETKVEVAPPTEVNTPSTNYTNVTYKDGVNTYTFSNIEEAKANLKVKTLSSSEAKKVANSNKSTYNSMVKDLVDQINQYRKSKGLSAVKLNDNLTNAAMERAAESAYANWNMTAYEGDAKRHIRPNYKKASSIAEEYGISGNFGENYARYQANTTEALEGWKNSSAHNAVLTSSKYTKVGIGIAQDSEGYYYWIAIFN